MYNSELESCYYLTNNGLFHNYLCGCRELEITKYYPGILYLVNNISTFLAIFNE